MKDSPIAQSVFEERSVQNRRVAVKQPLIRRGNVTPGVLKKQYLILDRRIRYYGSFSLFIYPTPAPLLYITISFGPSTSTLFNLGALDKIYPSVSYGLLYLTGSRTMYEPITPRMRRGVRESPFFQLT